MHLQKAQEFADLQKELERCASEKFSNVDSFMAGNLDQELYQKRRMELTKKENTLKQQAAVAEQQLSAMEMGSSREAETVIDRFHEYSDQEQLTEEMVKALVKTVRVTDSKHIEIEWNFSEDVYKFFTEE